MSKMYAKIKNRQSANKYRIFIDSDTSFFGDFSEIIDETVEYNPSTVLEKGVWYYIANFSAKDYFIEILSEDINPVDYGLLSREEYEAIDFVFEAINNYFYFQNIGKAKLIKKKGILRIGNDFKYYEDFAAIPINEYPDAIYDKQEDKLYFRELSCITRIFPGIGELFREATDKETTEFLSLDFVVLGTDLTIEKVKSPNRKRITLTRETLSKMNPEDKKQMIKYIIDYYPQIKNNSKSFKINSDDDLKMLLYGIEERFYTTQVGNEKRIANSVITM